MADNGRRPGDWQHKELRQNANDILKDPNEKKWYDQTFWIVFFLVVFCPVGLVLMWRSNWHVALKVVVTLFLVVAVYFNWHMMQAVQQMQLG